MAILAVLVVVLFYIQGSRERTAPFLFLLEWGGADNVSGARIAEEPLPVPRSAELDVDRARVLLEKGHPRDALRLLERIGPGDPLRAEAAQLRQEIQRTLLSKYEGGGGANRRAPPTRQASRRAETNEVSEVQLHRLRADRPVPQLRLRLLALRRGRAAGP